MSGKPEAQRPRKLGRGLSSLMQVEVPVEVTSRYEQNANASAPSTPAPSAAGAPVQRGIEPAADAEGAGGLRYIEISRIEPNRYQPRRVFDADQIKGLSESIRRSGVMQPIVVRPLRDAGGTQLSGRFELVAGERRWRAASEAGLTAIPALVRELGEQEAAEWAVVENVQRTDLNPIERADAFSALADRFGLTHAQIGERVGMDRSSVANIVRLAELEPEIRDLLASGALSTGHGKALLGLPPGPARVQLASRAAAEGWPVRQLEVRAGPDSAGSGAPEAAAPIGTEAAAGVRDLEKRLGEYLGTKIQLRTNTRGTRGRIVIEFYGLDHFDGLMSRIGFRGA